MHSLCFKFPPASEKNFGLRGKFSQFDLFPQNFTVSVHFPSILEKLLLPLLLQISPLIWSNLRVFFTYFMCFLFPL